MGASQGKKVHLEQKWATMTVGCLSERNSLTEFSCGSLQKIIFIKRNTEYDGVVYGDGDVAVG